MTKKEKDKCVFCGVDTVYNKSDHVDTRMYYVEGAGQLCRKCFIRIYRNK